MEMIGWGILGNATIARLAVVPAIMKAHNSYVAAIGSRSMGKAQALATMYQGDAVADYEAVLAHHEVTAVYIPLPNHLHKTWTLKALAAGKHVLVEKPFALNVQEAREMTAAAANANRLLSEAVMWRYHPRSLHIRQLIQDGELGTVRSIRAAFTFIAHPDKHNQRLFNRAMGGGSLLDVGTYGVSLARWLLASEPESVTAQAVWNDDGVDLGFAGTMRFGTETLAVVECGFGSALQQSYIVAGDKGAIEFARQDAFIPGTKEATFIKRLPSDDMGKTVTIKAADQYQLMIEHFAAAIGGETRLALPADDSIKQMTVLDALQLAARSQQTINL